MLTEVIAEGRIMDDFFKNSPLFANLYVLIVFFPTLCRYFFYNCNKNTIRKMIGQAKKLQERKLFTEQSHLCKPK